MKTPSVSARAHRRGFTLIELLTVIAIIGILASILIPTVSKVRESARAAQCSSNLRQIAVALRLHVQDNQGNFPAASRPKLATETGSGSTITWGKALRPYLPLIGSTDTSREHPVFVCGSAEYAGKSGSDLGNTYSCTGAMLGASRPGAPYGATATTARPLSSIPTDRHTRTPLIIDGKADTPTATSARSNVSWTLIQPDIAASDPSVTQRADFRHNGRMNVAYVDGSVRAMDFAAFRQIELYIWNGLPQ